jgi:copper chaperone
MQMSRYSVPEMVCGHCKKTVEAALKALDARAEIEVDLDKHELGVATTASTEQVIASLKTAGYEAAVI